MELQWDSPVVQIIFAVLLVILPLSITEIPVMWKCLLWVVAWGMLIHLGLTFIPSVGKLSMVVQISLVIGLSAFLLACTYNPILKMWRAERSAVVEGDLYSPYIALPIMYIGDSGTSFIFCLMLTCPNSNYFMMLVCD